MSGPARSRIARNSLSGTVAQVTAIVASLFTTPLILGELGPSRYGVLAVVGSLTSYFGLTDLGIGRSLTRFLSVHQERGERERAGALVAFGMLFYLALGALLLVPMLLAAPAIGRFLEFPADQVAVLPGLLAAVLGLFVGWAVVGVLSARLVAAHRMDLSSVASVLGSVALVVMVLVVLPAAPSILTVFACMAGQALVTAGVMAVLNLRVNGGLLASPLRLTRAEIGELFGFSLWTQLASVTAVVNLEADKVIISRGVGVASVTPYHVANRLAMMTAALPGQLLTSLLPSITARIVRGLPREELAALYERATRTLMLSCLVIAGFVAGGADALLRLWLNQRLPGAAGLCAALVASYAFNFMTGTGTTVLRARGAPRLETLYGTVSAALNVGLTVLLIGPFGLAGVVAGTILGNLGGTTLFLILFHRREGIGWWSTTGRWLVRMIFVTAAAGAAVSAFLSIVAAGADRAHLLLPLAVAGLGYLALFVLLGAAVGLWTNEDRHAVAGIAARLPRRGRTA